jgi:hypothetical protein
MVNADYVRNIKKLLNTLPQDAPFWWRMNTQGDTVGLVHIYIIQYAKD